MATTLVVAGRLYRALLETLERKEETAGVLLAKLYPLDGDDLKFVASGIRWIPDDAYAERKATSMSIRAEGYMPALREAETQGATPFWLHTHPGFSSSARPSKRDKVVDEQIQDLFRLRSG